MAIHIHNNDLPKFYNSAFVFSLVSDRGIGRGEGIPLTPLEAMSCGTPIIVGNHDGSQEAIFPKITNGFLINPFDLQAHEKNILELFNQKFEKINIE